MVMPRSGFTMYLEESSQSSNPEPDNPEKASPSPGHPRRGGH